MSRGQVVRNEFFSLVATTCLVSCGCSRSEDARLAEVQAELQAAKAQLQAAQAEAEQARLDFARAKKMTPKPQEPGNAPSSDRPGDPAQIVQSWTFPGAEEGRPLWAFKSTTMSPYTVDYSTEKPFDEVWNHYAAKCGAEHRYQKYTQQRYAAADKEGSYAIFSAPSQLVNNRMIGDDWACFTRMTPAYEISILIRRLFNEDGEVRGTSIVLVCVLR